MKTLTIPSIGEKVTLAQDWTFDLYNEYRNVGMMMYIDDNRKVEYGEPDIDGHPVTLPAGSVLTIDRIFIRRGMPRFNSVTFILNGAKVPDRHRPAIWTGNTQLVSGKGKRARFWAKLEDVNKMIVE